MKKEDVIFQINQYNLAFRFYSMPSVLAWFSNFIFDLLFTYRLTYLTQMIHLQSKKAPG